MSTLGNTIQLMKKIDLTKLTATENQKYFINPSAPQELYSKQEAPPPRPIGLYTRTNVSYGKNKNMRGWIPNVRFLNNNEKELSQTRAADGSKSLQYRHYQSLHFFSVPTFKHTFDVASEKAKLENPQKSTNADRLPTLGILGKNDCGHFASSLQNLIASEEPQRINKGAVSEKLNVNDPANANKLSVGVGDNMFHHYKGIAQNSGHHSSTIVAKGGSSLVTLEAHVGKSLEKPEFHIRNGVKGFVADNNVGHGWTGKYDRGLGDSVSIGRIGNLKNYDLANQKRTNEQSYRGMSDPDFGIDYLKGIGTVKLN